MTKKERLPERHRSMDGWGGKIILLSFIAVVAMFFYSCSPPRKGSTITNGKARFEFLTPSLVRMEYAPSGRFVNAPTVVVKRRNWPKVSVQTTNKEGWLTMQTSLLKVRYKLHSGPFTKGNLTVAWRDSTGSGQWHPGQKDSLNLGGLIRSYNQIPPKVSPFEKIEKTKGLLSRSGYFLLDDSHSPVWDSAKAWIAPRPDTNDQDWYLFTYGRNYKKVLNEFAQLSGRIPMIPRYTMGAWITDFNFEYFPGSKEVKKKDFRAYNETHLKKEILRFRRYGIPLDILVMDFGWHNYGWEGGYDWSPLIPHPAKFLTWLHAHGIKVTLNDHPGYTFDEGESVLSYHDSHAPEVLKELGWSMPVKPGFKIDLTKDWQVSFKLKKTKYFNGFKNFHGRVLPNGISLNNKYLPQNKKGYVWFYKKIELPDKLPDSLYLVLGRLRNQYTLYLNGKKVSHTVPHWFRFHTYANISSYVKPGQNNSILLGMRYHQGRKFNGLSVVIQNITPSKPIYFNLANKRQAEIFTGKLLEPLMKEGVNFWWIDGGTGAANMPGLNAQLWTNRVYYNFTQQLTNKRGFIFSRYGGWGNQRYPAFFTGDADSRWPILNSEVLMTARGGNVLMPYITNDIGGFRGNRIPFNLYARWVEFGTFSPILRLHSAHENPEEGNARMPWTYGKKGIALDRKYFNLRYKLLPYIYTYVRHAYDKSLPLLRPLYLEYPKLSEAYSHPYEYFFGKEMLVAPIVDSTGTRTIYLPPGKWYDFFTGRPYKGAQSFTAHYNVDQVPVFVRAGSIIPGQTSMAYSNQRPLDTLTLQVYGPKAGKFDLYEDDGISLNYKKGAYAWTPIAFSNKRGDTYRLTIGPTDGRYAGQVKERAYIIRVLGIQKPQRISMNHQTVVQNTGSGTSWSWDARKAIFTIKIPPNSIRNTVLVEIN